MARELERLGAYIIDADVLAREVVAHGTPGLAAVVRRFGDGVLDAHGALDRAALGRLVFSDPQALADLNAIVHPLVRARAAELEAAAPAGAVVVHVIPLLVETGQARFFDEVVVVDTSVDNQLERLMRRNGYDRAEAERRVASQASRDARLAAADWVLDSSGPVEATMRQVRALWEELSARGRVTFDRSTTGPSPTR